MKITAQRIIPFPETIRLAIEPEAAVEFPLYLRLPGWCATPQITVNDTTAEARAAGRGVCETDAHSGRRATWSSCPCR